MRLSLREPLAPNGVERQDSPTKHSRSKRTRAWAWVALISASTLLIQQPAGAHHDEIVDKRAKGTTELVSKASDGRQGDGPSGGECPRNNYSASDDGRFIAFVSQAGNLHPADANGSLMADVFVFDRKTDKLELVSVMPHGLAPEVPDGVLAEKFSCPLAGPVPSPGSFGAVISGNGRYVAFESNLPLTGVDDPTGAGPGFKVFVRDLKRHRTELVSLTSRGIAVVGDPLGVMSPMISDDGRFVSFLTDDPLVTDDPCPSDGVCGYQAYVRDRKKGETLLISRSNAGERAATTSVGPAFISGNGRYVAFEANAANLVDQTEQSCPGLVGCSGVWVHDLEKRSTELVSLGVEDKPVTARLPSYNQNFLPQILSDDGRFVLFWSNSPDVVPANRPAWWSYHYVRDRKQGRTQRVSVSSTGTPFFAYDAPRLSISDDGRFVLQNMDSRQEALPGLAAEHIKIGGFWSDLATGQLDWVLHRYLDEGPAGAREAGDPRIGGNGRFVLFEGDDGVEEGHPPRVEGDTNGFLDVFVRDIERRPLSTGGYLRSRAGSDPDADESSICPETSCFPRGITIPSLRTGTNLDPSLTRQGELYGASLAYRPDLDDLFAAIELEYMPPVLGRGASPVFYGMRFEAGDRNYEVRASSLHGGTFAFFACEQMWSLCTKLTDLRGGYGTTGVRVVFSLPLDLIELDPGIPPDEVEVFSALGVYDQPVRIQDGQILERLVLESHR